LQQLTQDHVYAVELARAVQRGILSEAEAEAHPERSSLTSHLGAASLDEVDFNTEPLALQSGDCLLLCSDGLYRALRENEISTALQRSPSLAAEALVHSALGKQLPQQDNLTAVLMVWEPEDRVFPSRPLRWLTATFGSKEGGKHTTKEGKPR
jgi:protein phosphatase